MPLSADYTDRVYAGVLGKLIGVYLGRPFEGWTYERITAELGEIWYYVHERKDLPLKNHTLVVTDDDISGTFTFLRALTDYGHSRDLTPAQIGQTWLNYLIEPRTILWWGGIGNSTEHTAYLRLRSGIPAPESGSIALNGKVVAEQIGAQIFIDGWGMIAPGDPALAADFARRAGSVSHDGEAIYAAQVLAAMEAQAFVETNIDRLLDCGLTFIPRDSIISRLISDIRAWHAMDNDWRVTRARIAADYGYHRYGGNCHVVPNHALIILALLYGDDDFQKSLMIVNTAGRDTDCNSGNVGCLMGIKNGLGGIDVGPDWRGPIADRLYLPTADGGRAITDAVRETYEVVNIGRTLVKEPPLAPKGGARFHFSLPGAVQGFQPEDSVDVRGTVVVESAAGMLRSGERSLGIRFRGLAPGRVARVATPTFIPPETTQMVTYELLASPTLYPGQTVRARIEASAENASSVTCCLYIRVYGPDDALLRMYGPQAALQPGADFDFTWQIEATGGAPIADIGVEVRAHSHGEGRIFLDYLTWSGPPDLTLDPVAGTGTMWRRAWINGLDLYDQRWSDPYRIVQNRGTGLLIQGTREWIDYQVSAAVRPHLARSAGIGVRVQGMQRYYALLLCRDGKARLVKVLDGTHVLAEKNFAWDLGMTYALRLQVTGDHLEGWIDGELLFSVRDTDRPLTAGGIALVCEEGRVEMETMVVRPPDGETPATGNR